MFVQLTEPPRLAIKAELIPTLFGEQRLCITSGKTVTEYVVLEPPPCGEAVAQAVRLRREKKEYGLVVTKEGCHYCTCEDFLFLSGRENRPCKHLVGAYLTGLLTECPPLLETTNHGERNEEQPGPADASSGV